MPIYLREKQENQAKPGSLVSELTRLKQMVVMLQKQLNKMTQSIRQLKSEKHRMEIDMTRKDTEMKRLKAELQRITKGKRGGNDFGDF